MATTGTPSSGKNQHKEKFSPESYYKRLNHVSKTDDYFFMRICDSLDTGKHKGRRFLDIGCGPSFIPSLAASRVFTDIYLSDYAPSNLEHIRKWFDKDPGADDWSEHINYLAERYKVSPDAIETGFRQSVKGFYQCDITKDGILMNAEPFEPFHCITSSLCLEAGCSSHTEYRAAIKRLRSLLAPGGTVIICGSLGSCYYKNGDETFPHLCVNAEQVDSAFKDAGYTDVKICCRDVPEGASYTGDPKGTYILTAINLGNCRN